MTELERIGWIGTGVMGQSMARHLIDAGHPVTVTTRTPAKADALVTAGAVWCDSAIELREACDVVITMLGYPSDVEAIYLGDRGLLSDDEIRARLVIDMTTSEPHLAERVAARATALGLAALDAPVSGGDVGARNATLSIMVGGDAEHVEKARPILERLGKNIVHQGAAGAGQHTKMVNQTLIATNMIGVCEGLLYAKRAGLDPTRVIESVGSGAAGSWSIQNLGPRIIAGDFAPGFFVEHFIKDMGIALAEAERLRLALPGLALAKQLYEAVRAQGHGASGTQALMLALERLSPESGKDGAPLRGS